MPDTRVSRSQSLYERACRVMPGGNTRTTVFRRPFQVYAQRGDGCRIIDVDGRVRMDALGNFTSLIHGYGNKRVLAAARQLELGSCFGMPTEHEIRLSEMLRDRLPCAEHWRYTNSGTEAVMNAVKAARAVTGRTRIAKCEGAYHGTYDPAETSQESAPANWGDIGNPTAIATAKGTPRGVLEDVVIIPFNNTVVAESILRRHASSLAGVLIDLMPNRAGLVPATPEFTALTPGAFDRLERLGEQFVAGVRECFERQGVEGQLTGLGSLWRVHLTAATLSDYRSTVSAGAAARVAALAKILFDEGVIISGLGLVALSTAMTPADVDEIVAGFDRALKKI